MFSYMNYTFNSYSMNSTCLNVIVSFQFNMTPLHYASKRGHNEVVLALISHGATVDMKDRVSSIDNVYLHELIL